MSKRVQENTSKEGSALALPHDDRHVLHRHLGAEAQVREHLRWRPIHKIVKT